MTCMVCPSEATVHVAAEETLDGFRNGTFNIDLCATHLEQYHEEAQE